MKKISLTVFSLALAIASIAQNWNAVTNSGTSFILYGMSFPSGQNNIGYACGMQYTYNADGIIVKTTDGGDNWTQIWPVSGDIDGLQGIWFINETLGFAGGWNNYFIKTTDGGATWNPVSCGSNVWYYTDVVFYDANNGVASAFMNTSDQCVFITSDGGNTWTPATSGIATNLMGICYADQTTLYAVSTTTLYKSVDGGHNWTTVNAPAGMYFGIDFADPNFGVIGAEEEIYATNDGGATWTTFTTGYENFYATKAFSDGTAYVGGTNTNIYATYDYGNSWAADNAGTTSHLYRIRSTPDGTLTACGSQGTIMQRPPVLAANFSADNTNVCEGSTVNFTDMSTGAVTSWNWTFEGGTPATSTDQNPSVTYNTSGSYDVTLEVSNGSITNSTTETDYITVIPNAVQPSTPSGPDVVCGGEAAQYTTSPVSGADSYIWVVDPQDAGTLNGTGISVAFTAATDWTGTCNITVAAENSCGIGPYSQELSVTIQLSPDSYFLDGGGSYCEGSGGLELTLDGSQSGVDYELFLYGSTTGVIVAGTGSPISFGFQTAGGAYSATGYNSSCSVNMTGQPFILVLNTPGQAGQPEGPESVCNNSFTTYITSGSTDADTLIWVLDPAEAGNMTPGGNLVEIEWDDSFTGTATLSVYGSNDCGDGSSSPEQEINVSNVPAPEISGLNLVCEDDYADYSTTENPGSTYTWTVEGGSITSGAGTYQITVQWGTFGNGYVRVAEDNGACSDSTENFEVQIDECTGIEDPQSADLRIYPNPTSSVLTIEFGQNLSDRSLIKVWNMYGKLMDETAVEKGTGKVNINVSEYPSGMYLLEVGSQSIKLDQQRFMVIR